MAESASSTVPAQRRRPLSSDRVPVLPPGVVYVVEALNDDNLGFREIATVIEKLPSVAARLLALANSAWSSPVSPILALDAACSRLGLQVVRTASIAIAVSQPFNPARCQAFDGRRFWSAALLSADAASWLAQQGAADQQSVARTAGLLSNLGLIWLAEALPEQTATALISAKRAPHGHLDAALAEHCGLGYVEAGALLAEAWRLPSELCDAIAGQSRGCQTDKPLCRIVGAATRIASVVMREEPWESGEQALQSPCIEVAAQQAVFDRVLASRAATVELADNLFSRT